MALDITATVTAGAAALAALFGGGMFNRFIKQSNEMAVTKHILAETKHKLEEVMRDVASLKNNSVETETRMKQFDEQIRKLDMIPNLSAQLQSMASLIDGIQKLLMSLAQDRITHGN